MGKIPIALQLYSVREICARDVKGAIAGVAEIGYEGAEPWGYDGTTLEWMGVPATELRAACSTAFPGAHGRRKRRWNWAFI